MFFLLDQLLIIDIKYLVFQFTRFLQYIDTIAFDFPDDLEIIVNIIFNLGLQYFVDPTITLLLIIQILLFKFLFLIFLFLQFLFQQFQLSLVVLSNLFYQFLLLFVLLLLFNHSLFDLHFLHYFNLVEYLLLTKCIIILPIHLFILIFENKEEVPKTYPVIIF